MQVSLKNKLFWICIDVMQKANLTIYFTITYTFFQFFKSDSFYLKNKTIFVLIQKYFNNNITIEGVQRVGKSFLSSDTIMKAFDFT